MRGILRRSWKWVSQRASHGFEWGWHYKFRVAVLALVFMLVAPRPVKSQFLDPCCAILEAGLSTIASTLSSVIGGGLNSILSVDQTIKNFEQTVVWPEQLIAEAKSLVGQIGKDRGRLPVPIAIDGMDLQINVVISRDGGHTQTL